MQKFRFALVWACAALLFLAAPGRASAATGQEAFAEAEALAKKADALHDKGDVVGATEALDRSIELQRTQIVDKLPEPAKPTYLAALSPDEAKLVGWLIEAKRYARAAFVLDRLIRFEESQGAASKYRTRLPDWKTTLTDLKKETASDDVREGLVLLRGGRTTEGLLRLKTLLAEGDAAAAGDPEVRLEALTMAARALEDAYRYGEAERVWTRAVAFADARVLKARARVLLGQGHHYLGRGDAARAKPAFARAYDLATASMPEHLVAALLGLARVDAKKKDFPSAVAQGERALEQARRAPPSPGRSAEVFTASLVVASICEEAGRMSDAAARYDDANKELGSMPTPQLALLARGAYVRAYGWYLRRTGDLARAEALLTEALEIKKKLFGDTSFAADNGRCDLGEVYWAAGKLAKSLGPIASCFDARERNLAQVLAAGTEDQKKAYLMEFVVAYQKTLTADLRAQEAKEAMTELAFTQVLRTKGRVLEALTTANTAVLRGLTASERTASGDLALARATLSQAASSGADPARMKQAEQEIAALEAKLSAASESYRSQSAPVTIERVRKELPADHALVELVYFQPLDKNYKNADDAEPHRYIAYVLVGGERRGPVRVDLGDARTIDETVLEFRKTLASRKRDPAPAAKLLYERVVRPLEAHLGGKTKILLAPDGALSLVPFAAFQKNGTPLLSTYTFSYLTSGRELLRPHVKTENGSVVFANPTYDAGTGAMPSSSPFATMSFEPLPGTLAEANAISASLDKTEVFEKARATERAVKAVSRPKVLHLATHGYFLSRERFESTAGTRAFVLDDGAALDDAVTQNPLVRSGLAFYGAANLRGGDGEDGMLTALEASGLDLRGTDLVVLSACQTGLGEASSGEGVYGLRRALVTAGAESTLLSLWSVSDAGTEALMRAFYTRIRKGESRAEALRSAQAELVAQPKYAHPFYWASFVLSGRSDPIAWGDAPSQSAPPPKKDSAERPSSHDWDTYEMPDFGVSAGIAFASLADASASATQHAGGTLGFLRAEGSLISAVWEEYGSESRGLSIYDRAQVSLFALALDGDELSGFSGDYKFLVGYRFPLVGVFAGAALGFGGLALDDTLRLQGTYAPFAARLELPWFGSHRLSVDGMFGTFAGDREVLELEGRVPVGSVFASMRYQTSSDKANATLRSTLTVAGLGAAF